MNKEEELTSACMIFKEEVNLPLMSLNMSMTASSMDFLKNNFGK